MIKRIKAWFKKKKENKPQCVLFWGQPKSCPKSLRK